MGTLISLEEARALREEARRAASDNSTIDPQLAAEIRRYVELLHGADDALHGLEQIEAGDCYECGRAAERWVYGRVEICRKCITRRVAYRDAQDG